MKILIVTADWSPQGGGGITRFAKGLVQGLVNNHCSVEILLEEDGPHSRKTTNVEYECIIHGIKGRNSPLKRALAFAGGLWHLYRKAKYDAVIAITWSPCGTGACLFNLLHRIPYWVICHGNDVLEPQRSFFYTRLMRNVFRSAKGILPNSGFTANSVSDLDIPRNIITVIGCGIIPQDLKNACCGKSIREQFAIGSKPLLVTVGRLVNRKGQDMVILALPKILQSFPETIYMIVGEGKEQERLERLAAETGVKKNVIFTGFINDDEMYTCMAECDLFVMASRDLPEEGEVEGFGIVFLEAGCFRKPVIAGRAGGMVDPVVDGETGYLVDPTNPEDIAQKIVTLLDNKERCERMGSAGYERVMQDYTWDAVARRVLAALQVKS